MAVKRRNTKIIDTEPQQESISRLKKTREVLRQKIKSIADYPWRKKIIEIRQYVRQTDYKQARWQLKRYIKKIKIKKRIGKMLHKSARKVADFPKALLIGIPTFMFCYYTIGCLLSENIDVKTEYVLQDKRIPMIETADTLSFLLRREVDDKMWTPNLPLVFPAYILDNMPNFQIGIVQAVKDVTDVIRHFNQNTDAQKKEIKKAAELLAYPSTVWLMSKKDGFRLAPSSNAQYRKAAAELHKFGKDGVFYPRSGDLETLLQKVSKSLQKLAAKNENWQLEHDTDLVDTKADDLFYYAKGYAFAAWQINKTLGADFRETILNANLYTEWTYWVNSLKKAAEFGPRVIRNAKPQSFFAANHLLMQNYYLLRAVAMAENIINKLSEESDADKN